MKDIINEIQIINQIIQYDKRSVRLSPLFWYRRNQIVLNNSLAAHRMKMIMNNRKASRFGNQVVNSIDMV